MPQHSRYILPEGIIVTCINLKPCFNSYVIGSENLSTKKVMEKVAEERHQYLLQSLHLAYPYLKRSLTNKHTLEPQLLSTNVLPLHSLESTTNQSSKTIHLVQHFANLTSRKSLNDGVSNLELGTIVALQPSRSNALPWFAKALSWYNASTLTVMWMDSVNSTHSLYHFMDSEEQVSIDAVICNGVEFEPVFGDTLLWRILTPISFIQALNSEDMPKLSPALVGKITPTKPTSFDITGMVFADKEQFLKFLQGDMNGI